MNIELADNNIIMVEETVTVIKLEEDRGGFLPPASSTQNQTASHETTTSNNDSGAAAVAETDIFDKNLALGDFVKRCCLVKLQGRDAEGNADTKLWPALRYESFPELYKAVGNDVNFGSTVKILTHFDQQTQKGNKVSGSCGIAYLFGMNRVKDSFIPLGKNTFKPFECINEVLDEEEYKSNQKFQLALAIVRGRYTNESLRYKNEEEDDDEDDDSQSHDETVALDGTQSSPSSSNQANVEEVITIEDTPAKAGGENKKRKGKDKDDGAVSKKKKITKQTPKTKSSRATAPPMVTPLPADSGDKDIAEYLARSWDSPHRVMEHAEARKLLEDKFGVTCVDDNFYVPSQDMPVASSLMGLRKDLCDKGLPESTQPLSREEKINVARWVRYAHVKELGDGQYIKPEGEIWKRISQESQGKPINNKFMVIWVILRNNFGCHYSVNKYSVPTSPNGGEIKVCEGTSEAENHFARFGIKCIPDNPGDQLSHKDRLSIELFFATPSFNVLNTL